MKKKTHSEKETYDLAKKFASKLKGGEVLCLVGDLGAGKTAFTKGLAAGLGVKGIVTSPTFVLMKIYPVKSSPAGILLETKLFNGVNKANHRIKEMAHIDAYRLKEGQELINIGAEEYFRDKECVTVIEWADRVKEIWPKGCTKIYFKILNGDERVIEVKK